MRWRREPGRKPLEAIRRRSHRWLEARQMALWTAGDEKSVWVVTAKSASGREYLKAETDWVQPTKLLALPDCP
jgi:hypothetical protein